MLCLRYRFVAVRFITCGRCAAAGTSGGTCSTADRFLAVHHCGHTSQVEGVLKPDTWAAMDDPFGAETDDEEAEEFNHKYYR